MRKVLRNREFRLVWLGHTISQLGDGISTVAWLWILTRVSESTTELSLVFAAYSLPQVVLLIWGGSIADNYSTRSILIFTETSNAILTLILGILVVSDFVTIPIFVLISLALGAIQSFSSPAYGVVYLRYLPDSLILQANSLRQLSSNTAALAGPPLGGALIAIAGAGAAIFADALTFLVILIAVAMLRSNHIVDRGLVSSRASLEGPSDAGWRSGLRFITLNTGVLVLVAVFTISNGLNNVEGVLVPTLALNDVGVPSQTFGFFASLMALGSMLTAIITARWSFLQTRLLGMTFSGLAGFGIVISLMGISQASYHFLLLYFMMGVTFTLPEIANATIIQKITPVGIRGRVFAALSALSMAANPLGYVAAGVAGDLIGLRMAIVSAGVLICLLALMIPASRSVRRAAETSAPSEA